MPVMKVPMLHEAPPSDTGSRDEVPVSAYERAADQGVDPRCIPQYLDGTPPMGAEIVAPIYSAEHHANWSYLFNRQMALLPGRAGASYMEGVRILGMDDAGIPALADLSARMEAATGLSLIHI